MEDEGIGPRVIAEIEARYDCAAIDLLDCGTAGFAFIHLLENREKAVIIDCAFMDAEPGQITRFTPDEVSTTKKLAHASLHEADIMGIVELHRRTSQNPAEIIIFGIQPFNLRQGRPLSPLLEKNMALYASAVAREAGIPPRKNRKPDA